MKIFRRMSYKDFFEEMRIYALFAYITNPIYNNNRYLTQ